MRERIQREREWTERITAWFAEHPRPATIYEIGAAALCIVQQRQSDMKPGQATALRWAAQLGKGNATYGLAMPRKAQQRQRQRGAK